MSFVTHVVEVLVIAGVLGALGLAVAFVVARRYLRRRWHLVRRNPATRAVLAAGTLALAGRERAWARATPARLTNRSASRVRRRMWVAVEDAEAAVAHVSSRDAPVADLPSVCRSLRGLAGELDGLLRHERRLPQGTPRGDGLRSQVAELVGACRDVQAAALRAGSEAAEPQVRALVRRAAEEVDIASAGLARLRSVAQPR
ncbi:MAG TPA: hypothetical protein VG346_13025 [Acidimicrobiales bacterium]|nr:hypothetical protein [Acidimicrobiales bacterium]